MLETILALLIILTIGSTAAFHLGARATITAWLHSRYPGWLSSYMNCAACSGTLYGAAIAAGFAAHGVEVPLTGDLYTPTWGLILVGAAAGQVMTPLGAMLHERALRYLSGEAAEAPTVAEILARLGELSPTEAEAQRRSFAYGNMKLANEAVTCEMVDEAATQSAVAGLKFAQRVRFKGEFDSLVEAAAEGDEDAADLVDSLRRVLAPSIFDVIHDLRTRERGGDLKAKDTLHRAAGILAAPPWPTVRCAKCNREYRAIDVETKQGSGCAASLFVANDGKAYVQGHYGSQVDLTRFVWTGAASPTRLDPICDGCILCLLIDEQIRLLGDTDLEGHVIRPSGTTASADPASGD